jgi:gliding motility-associated-like protein
MKKYFSIAVALLMTTVSISKNTSFVNEEQLPTPPISNSKIKQVVREKVQSGTTNFGTFLIAKQKDNPLLSIGQISQFTVPVADLDVSDSTGCAPLTDTFTDNSTFIVPIDTWLWNFGDGTSYSTDGSPPAHVYVTPGIYFASLEVCNASGCSTENITITVNGIPTISNLLKTCTISQTDFTVSFDVANGAGGAYTVTENLPGAIGGSFTANSWLSNPIPIGTYDFDVADIYSCSVNVSGNKLCVCVSDAGTMDMNPLDLCETDIANAVHNLDHNLDADDYIMYVLHTNNTMALGTVIDTNVVGPTFSFSSPLLTVGVMYYISAVVGDSLGNFVDFNDGCLQVAPGTPVTWRLTPDAGANDSTTIRCNSSGSTIDLNTLLTVPAGALWSETSASGQFTPATGIFDANGLTAGVYAFTYTVSGTNCPDAIAYFGVTVIAKNEAGNDDLTVQLCNDSGNTLDLNTLLIGNTATGVWSESSASGQFNTGSGIFSAANLTEGNYTFVYFMSNTLPCSNDSAIFMVTVNDCRPVAGFTVSDISICRDSFVTFIDTSSGSPTDYQWSFPGGTPATSTSANPGNIVYNTVGVYQASLVVANASGTSQDSAHAIITVLDCDPAIAAIIMNDDDGEICINDCILFNYNDTLGGVPDSLIWSFQGINSPLDTVITNYYPQEISICWNNNSIGTFIVSVSAINAYNNAVQSVAYDTVMVRQNPIISAGNDVTIDIGFDAMIQAELTDDAGRIIASPSGDFVWSPDIFLSAPYEMSSEVLQAIDTTLYTVSYTDENGCTSSDDVIVNINFLFFMGVPTAFTPQASSNNILSVKGKLGIRSLNFVIYNRYGQKVFESTDTDKGWDGTQNGKELNPGVFVYYVKATYLDGSKGELKGNVTLIK